MSLNREEKTKYVTVFVDLEDKWGSPISSSSNLNEAIESISRILRRFRIRAVFNTCGKIIEEKPRLIRKLHSEGHEIASHGWAHENFLWLGQKELAEVLSRTETAFQDAVGDRIRGIRPPFLMSSASCGRAPCQSIDAIVRQISKRGYKWISFRKIVFAEEWKEFLNSSPMAVQIPKLRKNLLSMKVSLQEKLFVRTPRIRRRMLDIPLTSSMDCDILGLKAPTDPTSKEGIDNLTGSLKQQFGRSGSFFNLNFHEWIIGSSNRPRILQRILDFIDRDPRSVWVLASDLVRKVRL